MKMKSSSASDHSPEADKTPFGDPPSPLVVPGGESASVGSPPVSIGQPEGTQKYMRLPLPVDWRTIVPISKQSWAHTLSDIEYQLIQRCVEFEEAETDETRALAETALRELFAQEVRKVDGIAGAIRRFGRWAEAAAEERDRVAARAKSWKTRVERIKAHVLAVMQAFDVKRLETPTNTLRRHGQADKVEITDFAALPPRYKRFTVSLRGDELALIRTSFVLESDIGKDVQPCLTEIAAELKAGRQVPGARLLTNVEHLRIE